jgi:hypothetical protein
LSLHTRGDLHVGVVIPAHDEAATIGAAVDSVRASLLDAAVHATIVVVADACSDDTAAVARAHLGPDDTVLEVRARSVGMARAQGAAVALERLGRPPRTWLSRTWLLSLDADSRAPRRWVARHLAHAERGIECVTGMVELDEYATPELRAALTERYLAHVTPSTHPHVHGTNFGIRGDTLLAAGNWPRLATGEDHALWQAVGLLGRPRVQDPAIVVRTSARLTGRAPSGFAADLAGLAGLADRADASGGADGPPTVDLADLRTPPLEGVG